MHVKFSSTAPPQESQAHPDLLPFPYTPPTWRGKKLVRGDGHIGSYHEPRGQESFTPSGSQGLRRPQCRLEGVQSHNRSQRCNRTRERTREHAARLSLLAEEQRLETGLLEQRQPNTFPVGGAREQAHRPQPAALIFKTPCLGPPLPPRPGPLSSPSPNFSKEIHRLCSHFLPEIPLLASSLASASPQSPFLGTSSSACPWHPTQRPLWRQLFLCLRRCHPSQDSSYLSDPSFSSNSWLVLLLLTDTCQHPWDSALDFFLLTRSPV